ncbi:homeobox-leucine zipper protein HAT4-like isoform X1 [Zingiber officinale]|uniref:homeobox-leucine zipper protein HAT4-like isoform X1 n=1 Tax=Zingiber officinale TaxID=94328 RepID=UPI001C4C5658|nr:homeobox-leucine zipper protein HAT4-like isoform X1 [Zingiber officinale]
MMLGKEDLGLSLSLSTASYKQQQQQPLDLMSSVASPAPFPCLRSAHWAAQLLAVESAAGFDFAEKRSAAELSAEEEEAGRPALPLLRGIDVNRSPGGRDVASEEDAGASSPNSTLSSVSGKRAERDGSHHLLGDHELLDADRSCSRGGISDDEDGGDGSRKKLRLSKDQSAVLEESFKEHNTLNPKQKMALAKQLNLRPRQVEVWFQNRRARTKLKQTEVDCDFLRRCCETLTEENRRLQKEVQELRALKLSPQLYTHMTPPTTLTMCPSCERVSNSNSNSAFPATVASSHATPVPEHHRQFLHSQRQQIPSPWPPLRPFLEAPRQR